MRVIFKERLRNCKMGHFFGFVKVTFVWIVIEGCFCLKVVKTGLNLLQNGIQNVFVTCFAKIMQMFKPATFSIQVY